MTFEASTINDIDSIFQFYDMAVEYQKTKFNKHWKGFERDLVEKEISENRQWKIIINNEIACVFAITFEDENIWKEKNSDKAVYFHRIATHPKFKGQHFVEKIVAWGRLFAKEKKAQTSVTPQFPTNDVNTLFVCRGEQCSPVDLTFLQKKKGRKFDFPSL